MNELNSQNEKPKDQPRFSQEQYDMLKRCSDKKDMTEWNEWRKENPDEDIFLEGADLSHSCLRGVNLKKACLDNANFHMAHLEYALMDHASIQHANLRARLQNAKLRHTDLSGTDLWRAHLEGTDFYGACLRGAQFAMGQVSGETMIARCKIDRYTDFTGVALMNACVEPGLRQLLEYNVRWLGWNKWYDNAAQVDWDSKRSDFWKRHPPIWIRGFKKAFVRTFWLISDYGISTKWIVFTFFGLAFFFAAIYSSFAHLSPPGIVSNLEVEPHLPLWHYFLLLLLRPIYFSVVTMTTLGFGDMFANAHSIWGHVLLTIQVILGYVLLGALVTRFAVLFTAGGPAGKFAERTWDRPCPKPKTGWDELAQDKTILQTGDVIHIQSRGLLSKLVRFFSRADKEGPSWASHSAMVLRVGEEIEIIEALWRTLVRPITAYEGKKSKLLVCRKPGGIEERQKQKMVEKAAYYEGKPYGFWEISFHVLDRLLNNSYVFRRLIKDNDYPICSWLVAYVYDRVLGYQFGTPPNAAQPDDLLDHCLDCDWEFIWADSSRSVADFCRTYKLSDESDLAETT